MKSQLAALSEQLESAGNPLYKWIEFKKLFNKLQKTIEVKNRSTELEEIFSQIQELISYCCSDVVIHKEMRSIMDQVAKLLKHQHEIETNEKLYIKVDEALLMFAALYTGIDAIVPNNDVMISARDVRKRLGSHLRRTFNMPALKQATLPIEEIDPSLYEEYEENSDQ